MYAIKIFNYVRKEEIFFNIKASLTLFKRLTLHENIMKFEMFIFALYGTYAGRNVNI